MFRHKKNQSTQKDAPKSDVKPEDKEEKKPADEVHKSETAEQQVIASVSGEQSIKELLEKNLKWSQIIYEQNRKINHKLTWAAIASWLRLLLILIPLILAFLFLPSIVKDIWSRFDVVSGAATNMNGSSSDSSLENLIKVFNLSPGQKEQIKGLIK